jgi:protein-tyrosine phosphatase
MCRDVQARRLWVPPRSQTKELSATMSPSERREALDKVEKVDRLDKVSVLFVCTGNICRSPTAEGVLRALADKQGLGARVFVDSAGTHDYHVGEPPDPRTIKAARKRGYDLSRLRARLVKPADFERFHYIVAMDHGHHRTLSRACPPKLAERLHMMMSFAPELGGEEVPDPYYGGVADFTRVIDLCEAAGEGLLRALRQRLGV